MITNNELLKLFVRVPSTATGFNGAEVSGVTGEHRLFFEESTGKIWAKGVSYGLSSTEIQSLISTAIDNLLGEDDANSIIDQLSEVLDWFKNLPEEEQGALALVNLLGKPAELYTAADEQENPEHVEGTVKTAATGVFALIAQNAASIAQNASDIDAIETEIGEKGVKYTQAEANTANSQLTGAVASGDNVPADYETKVGTAAEGATLTEAEANAYNATLTGAKTTDDIKTPSTGIYKYVDDSIADSNADLIAKIEEDEQVTAASLNDLNTRVSALEAFDPWENYSA